MPRPSGSAQRLDARDSYDRGPDHREVEPVDRADIAVEHVAEMQREVERPRPAAGIVGTGLSASSAAIASAAASRARGDRFLLRSPPRRKGRQHPDRRGTSALGPGAGATPR